MRFARNTSAALSLICLHIPGASLAAEPYGIRFEAAYSHDDNVTRSRNSDKLSDDFFSFSVNKSFDVPVSRHTRLSLNGFIGADEFRNHGGLSRYSLGIDAEFQYRPSAGFGAPTFAVFGRGALDRYDSDLRDGYRYSAGLSVRKSITDRIELSGAWSYNIREGKSAVFDTREHALRLNADYALAATGTLYAGAEYRRGDTVSSAQPVLLFVDLAEAIVRDDAFPGMNLFAYRLNARTIITTLGYNWAFGNGHALDFSWRWIEATATDKPSFATADKARYRDNQFSVAYLYRF